MALGHVAADIVTEVWSNQSPSLSLSCLSYPLLVASTIFWWNELFVIVFRHVCRIVQSNCELCHILVFWSVWPSVRPSIHLRGTTWPSLNGFMWNLLLAYFSKICRENSSFINIWQEWWVLYRKIIVHFWSYLAQFFTEWENVSDISCRENQNTHFVFSNFIFIIIFMILPFMRQCGEMSYSRAGHRWRYGTCALHAGYLSLQIHTYSYCFSTATVVARTHPSVMSYVHCLSCFLFSDICNVSKKRDTWPMHQVLCRQTKHLVVKVQYSAVLREIRRITICCVLAGHKKDMHTQLSSNIRSFNRSW